MTERIAAEQAVALLGDLSSPAHCMSAGVAVSYFALGRTPIEFDSANQTLTFLSGFGARKVLTYDLQGRGVIPASSKSLSATKTPHSASKRKEYALDLPADASRLDKKSRYNEITRPVNLMERANYRLTLLDSSRVEEVESAVRLHDVWVVRKLADERVHRISFSSARYVRCLRDALRGAYPALVYALSDGSNVAAFRVVNTAGQRAYDLAFIADSALPWAARAMQWLSLCHLNRAGVNYINFGESTGKGLTHFKQRLGATTVFSFAGGAIDVRQEQTHQG